MTDFSIKINNQSVPVIKGQTVLQASLAAGIDIPVFCWHPQLVPVGACRICLVEIEKFPKLQVACATPATEGMVVQTASPKVVKARQGVLEFILAHHPLDCPTCDKGGECDLQDITFKYGLDYTRLREPKHRYVVDEDSTFDDLRIGPEVIRNQNRCIHCYRCTRIVDEACFEDDLGAYQRGNHTEILPPPGKEIRNLYSGNVVEYCPVGALTNTDWRYKVRVWLTKQAASVCNLCPDGCNTKLWTFHNKLFRSSARPNEAIDKGFLCDIGRHGYQFVQSPDRLKRPMIKRNGELQECTWDDALDFVKQHVAEHKAKLSGSGFFGLIGAGSSNEEMYSFQRLLRRVIGTNNIDHRLHRKRRLDLGDPKFPQTQPDTCTYQDLDEADTFVVFGSDLHAENPITALRLKRGVRYRDAKIIIINPRPTHLAVRTDAIQVVHRPATGIAALLGLINSIMTSPQFDGGEIDTATLTEFKTAHSDSSLAKMSQLCGVEPGLMQSAVDALLRAHNVVIIAGAEFQRFAYRDEELAALHNLRCILKNAKLLVMPLESNGHGAEFFGALPHQLPGGVALSARGKFEDLWRGPISDTTGKDTLGILEAINEDDIECGFVFNADPVRTFRDGAYARCSLEKLKTLIVIDSFMTDSARLADVILPLATFAETDGTRNTWEGRMQYSEAAIKPMHESKPGCEIIESLAEKLGSGFGQRRSSEVYAEMVKALVPGLPQNYRSIKPDGFLIHQTAKAVNRKLAPVTYNAAPEDKEYPLHLLVANADHHRGTLTERSESLMRFTGEPYVCLAPVVAHSIAASDGDLVRVESKNGKVVGKLAIIHDLPAEVVLLPENFSELRPNLLKNFHEKFDRVRVAKM